LSTETEAGSLLQHLAELRQVVDKVLDAWVPAVTVTPVSIHEAMRYSLFAGGKRIRPILAISAASAAGTEKTGVEHAAASLELIHTYSLIHDDLPALDNDDLRRGRPTCHKVFGEALAILAGDALLTLAFEVLARLPDISAECSIRLVAELARASGTVGGMIGGQVNDIEGERKTPDPELLESIHRAKTGALLRASVRMGAIYAGAGDAQLAALTAYGEHVGLAFQIVDDILDVEESSEQLGKTAGKDRAQHKVTFPVVYGLARSRKMADEELAAALSALSDFDARADRLRQIANYIVERKV